MTVFHALVLGIVEGITEFLPISSTAHLVLSSEVLRIAQTEFVKTFEIAIQLGAILAVIVPYWRSFLLDRHMLFCVIVGFIPTGIIGLLLHSLVKTYLLGNLPITLLMLFIGGIVLILFETFHSDTEESDLKPISLKQAAGIGLCQALALVPGVSRSAATILGGQMLGVSRRRMVEFSFLLAVPTMAAATGLDLLKSANTFMQADWVPLGIGFVTSFIVAYLTIRWFIRFVRSHSLVPFGIYRILIAVLGGVLLLR